MDILRATSLSLSFAPAVAHAPNLGIATAKKNVLQPREGREISLSPLLHCLQSTMLFINQTGNVKDRLVWGRRSHWRCSYPIVDAKYAGSEGRGAGRRGFFLYRWAEKERCVKAHAYALC